MNNNFLVIPGLFFILFSLSSATVSGAPNEINLTRSKAIQLALHLEVADPELKYDFIQIALSEMYTTYSDELDRSYKKLPRDPKKRAKISHWRYATQRYLDSLDQVFLLMDSGRTLDFFISPQNKIILLIGQQPIIISGPNTGANKQIETRIVTEFCERYDCRVYFAKTRDPGSDFSTEDQPDVYEPTSGVWSINNKMQAEFITTNGIIVSFNSLKDRSEKELWALKLVNEIETLNEGLDVAQNKGNRIQWPFVKIHELPITDNSYKITINSKGDFIKVYLPIIGAHSELFASLKPWLQSYFNTHRSMHLKIENAERYYQ